jgi:SAM-dependent methyltransferase
MSPGYGPYRDEFISRVLRDPAHMKRFKAGQPLPPNYGVGLDERCIEYPWLFSHLSPETQRLLDAGSALNHAFLLENPILARKKLHILTLAPEPYAFWQQGISYLYEDLREIPAKDCFYDEVACISTLEHVGMDSTFYTHRPEHHEESPGDFAQAIHELRRVLKPGGRLYLTVPYGFYRNIGVIQVFDAAVLEQAIREFGPAEASITYYRYTAQGWNVSTAGECAASEYVDCYFRYFMTPEQDRPAELPREPDLAAAARAVACVVLTRAMEPEDRPRE